MNSSFMVVSVPFTQGEPSSITQILQLNFKQFNKIISFFNLQLYLVQILYQTKQFFFAKRQKWALLPAVQRFYYLVNFKDASYG